MPRPQPNAFPKIIAAPRHDAQVILDLPAKHVLNSECFQLPEGDQSVELTEYFVDVLIYNGICTELSELIAHGYQDIDVDFNARTDPDRASRLAQLFKSIIYAAGENAPADRVATNSEAEEPHPELSAADLAAFKAHAAANPWIPRGRLSPSEYIRVTFAEWFGKGLSRAHISALPSTLGNAYAQEVGRHPERRILSLIEQPHALPAGTRPAPSMQRAAEQNPERLAERRRQYRESKARQRRRAPSP